MNPVKIFRQAAKKLRQEFPNYHFGLQMKCTVQWDAGKKEEPEVVYRAMAQVPIRGGAWFSQREFEAPTIVSLLRKVRATLKNGQVEKEDETTKRKDSPMVVSYENLKDLPLGTLFSCEGPAGTTESYLVTDTYGVYGGRMLVRLGPTRPGVLLHPMNLIGKGEIKILPPPK